MRARGVTVAGWLAVAVAVSQLAWLVWAPIDAGVAVPVVNTGVALVPVAVVVVAGLVLVRGLGAWVPAAASYLAVFAAVDAVSLPGQVHTLARSSTDLAVWLSTATSGAGLLLAVLAVAVVRGGGDEPATPAPTGAVRWLGVASGVVLAAAVLLPWWRQPAAQGVVGFWHWPLMVKASSVLGVLVVALVAVVTGVTHRRSVWLGSVAGLLASRPLVVGSLLDPARAGTGVVAEPAAWIALAAQVGLVVALALGLTSDTLEGPEAATGP